MLEGNIHLNSNKEKENLIGTDWTRTFRMGKKVTKTFTKNYKRIIMYFPSDSVYVIYWSHSFPIVFFFLKISYFQYIYYWDAFKLKMSIARIFLVYSLIILFQGKINVSKCSKISVSIMINYMFNTCNISNTIIVSIKHFWFERVAD